MKHCGINISVLFPSDQAIAPHLAEDRHCRQVACLVVIQHGGYLRSGRGCSTVGSSSSCACWGKNGKRYRSTRSEPPPLRRAKAAPGAYSTRQSGTCPNRSAGGRALHGNGAEARIVHRCLWFQSLFGSQPAGAGRRILRCSWKCRAWSRSAKVISRHFSNG